MADDQKTRDQTKGGALMGAPSTSGQPATQQGAITAQPPTTAPLRNDPHPEWIIAIPWVIPFLTLYAGFKLGQLGTRTNNVANLIKEDITSFLAKIEEYSTLVKTHQHGNPVENCENLRKSRAHLTQLRKTASSLHNRIEGHFAKKKNRDEWSMPYWKWKSSIEGESGLITRKADAWVPSQMAKLDEACDAYLAVISAFRCRVVSHSIKIKK